MTRKLKITTLSLVLVLLLGVSLWYWQDKENSKEIPSSSTTSQAEQIQEEVEEHEHRYTSEKGVEIIIDDPHEGESIVSPLEVSGQVPGNWSFEGMFPIKLLDNNGQVIAEATAQLNGDWMTDELVPFSATLTFTKNTGTGKLVLMNDNPSGLAENEDSLSLSLSFN